MIKLVKVYDKSSKHMEINPILLLMLQDKNNTFSRWKVVVSSDKWFCGTVIVSVYNCISIDIMRFVFCHNFRDFGKAKK